MVEKNSLKEVLSVALSNGGDFADIFMEEKQTTGIGMEAGKIERVHSGLDAGAGIRVLSGEVTAYAYTNDTSKAGLLEAAKIVSHAAKGSKRDLSMDLTTLKPLVDFAIKTRPESVPTTSKVELVKQVEKAARNVDKEKIKQVIVGYGDTVQRVTMANSEGVYVEDERIRTRMVVNVVAAEEGVIQTGYDAIGSHAGFELFEEHNPEEFAQVAAKRAVSMLRAVPAPSGKMPVVMAGEAGGTMVHEACGHGLEADLEQRELSVYTNKKGQQVASELVTVVDDATLPNRYGSYRFDDEGVPSRKVTMIENGILTDYLYDHLTATKEGRQSNGHGRRESYQHKPLPRMGNTYIAPGKEDPAKIIKDYKSGLLVKKMGGGQVNTTTGDFVFDVAEGYLIKDGEIGQMVRGATLTGNGPEVLNMVERVGSDLGFTIGTCGKDGQGAPVSDAQPTMAIKELVVGGTAHGDDGKQLSRKLEEGYGKIRRL
ncbi:microcin-processing peptidase 2, Unknown type peptidase, MEROPS family U62 [Desulforamulus reducens MI-1]|uniref:TldD/PmbA family protein n=1 Tax=Desulforamulus reducens (strain ATCC BAA-1160 / DSM 100696 / MI-1) TaxID=349161 RepID=A4J3B4_DESRM|nr:TldD/PmbA family protein [Desulforamulus reducens]ABO49567.1 microcin-processing peptidase 2, Unknown type peptidase, MEROPS family U62 [Desulforamulus reducens MI-1]